jgi:hypothetical protein
MTTHAPKPLASNIPDHKKDASSSQNAPVITPPTDGEVNQSSLPLIPLPENVSLAGKALYSDVRRKLEQPKYQDAVARLHTDLPGQLKLDPDWGLTNKDSLSKIVTVLNTHSSKGDLNANTVLGSVKHAYLKALDIPESSENMRSFGLIHNYREDNTVGLILKDKNGGYLMDHPIISREEVKIFIENYKPKQ